MRVTPCIVRASQIRRFPVQTIKVGIESYEATVLVQLKGKTGEIKYLTTTINPEFVLSIDRMSLPRP